MTYDKRIALFMTPGSFVVRSGIGHWCLSFLDVAEILNWKVDILTTEDVLNQRKTKDFAISFSQKADIHFKENKSYRNPWIISQPSLNMNEVSLFEQVLIENFKTKMYDMIICNDIESLFAVQNLGLSKVMPVVYFTHTPQLIWGDKAGLRYRQKYWYDFERSIINDKDVIIGTHSELNKQNLGLDNTVVLRPTVPERKLLSKNFDNKEGVLFIGRFEDRKNPDVFIQAIKDTGLPALVLCGGKHDKWHKSFKEFDIKNYEIIKATGLEKAKFIQKAKIAFHPASMESYGLGAFETIHSCPTVMLNEYNWTHVFEKFPACHLIDREDINSTLIKLYHNEFDFSKNLEYMLEYDKESIVFWKQVAQSNKTIKKTDLTAYLDKIQKPLKVKDWWVHSKRENSFDISEVMTLYRNSHLIHDDKNTYLTIDKSWTISDVDEEPTEKPISLFDF